MDDYGFEYSFEEFQLNTQQLILTHAGKEVPLEPRAFDLLVLLIDQRDRVVSKDEIIEHVWQGRFTSDAAITTCLKTVRKALQDDGEQQRLIRTLRGRGFRFVGDIRETSRQAKSIPDLEVPAITSVSTPSDSSLEVGQSHGKPSVIVLPFQHNEADNHAQLISEAIAHELIQALSRLRWLRVIARGTAFRFRQPDLDLAAVGQQLQVRYALCGSISQWGSGKELYAELADCQTGDVVWAERFQLPDDHVFQVREDILAQIISAFELYIPLHESSRAALNSTENLDAWGNYHLGLRSMYRFTAPSNQQAHRYFQEAIRQDPRFARAYAGLSFTRFQDAFLQYDANVPAAIADARRFAEQAVELDALDPFSSFNLGRSLLLEGTLDISQSWLERSVSLSPNFAQGYYSQALLDTLQGKVDLCITNSDTAMHLSPLDPLLYATHAVRALSFFRINDIPNAIDCIDKAVRTPGAHYIIQMVAAVIYAHAGQMDKSLYWRQQALQRFPKANAQHFFVALPFVDDSFRHTLVEGLRLADF